MSDPILARQVQAMQFHAGRAGPGRPGAVPAAAHLHRHAARRRRHLVLPGQRRGDPRQKRLPISLPQYLLHDDKESYPAVFPLFLALLSPNWLRSYFWLLSPIIDAVHLLLLYLLAFRLTDSVLAPGPLGLIYAVTPQLISETRNLNGRAFASLLQTIAMLT